MSSSSARGRRSRYASDCISSFLTRARHPFRASNSRPDDPETPSGSSGGSPRDTADRMYLGGSSSSQVSRSSASGVDNTRIVLEEMSE